MKSFVDPADLIDTVGLHDTEARTLYVVTDCNIRDLIGSVFFRDTDYPELFVCVHNSASKYIGIWKFDKLPSCDRASFRLRKFNASIKLEN